MKSCRLFFAAVCLFVVNKLGAQLTYNELEVEYDSAWACKNLELIPVVFKGPSGKMQAKPQTAEQLPVPFAEALQKHKIKLQEIQNKNGADVNWLEITNHSKEPVWIQSGEVVAGGKQDRMVAETTLLPAGKTDYLHVYCIEKRRWQDKPKEFATRGSANNELRKKMDLNSRQHEVWKEIDRQFSMSKKQSETFSYLELNTDSLGRDTACINYFNAMYNRNGQDFAGFVFITGNRIMSCELFGSVAFTTVSFNNVLKSYIRSAIIYGSPPATPAKTVKVFLDKFLTDEVSQKAFLSTHGKIHLSEGKVIHLVAYDD